MIKKLLLASLGVFIASSCIGKTTFAATVQGTYEGYSNNNMVWELAIGGPLYSASLSNIAGEEQDCTAYVKLHTSSEAPEEITKHYTSLIGKQVHLTNVTVIEKKRQPHPHQTLCEYEAIQTTE